MLHERQGRVTRVVQVILDRHHEGVLLVHGVCPGGADAIAAAYAARTVGSRTEAHPADWRRYGRAAGYRRNAEMIALRADGCAAFIRGGSPASTHAVRLARAAGIPVWLHTALIDSTRSPPGASGWEPRG
jgi:SLOG family YspA-like protein